MRLRATDATMISFSGPAGARRPQPSRFDGCRSQLGFGAIIPGLPRWRRPSEEVRCADCASY